MEGGAEVLNWIDDLSDDIRKVVLGEMKSVRAPANTVLFERHSPAKGLYRIVHGAVRLYSMTPEGREFVFKVYGRSESFGDAAAIDGRDYPLTAETLCESDLQFLSREQLLRLRCNYHAIESALVRFFVRIARSSVVFAEETAIQPLRVRVASRLSFLLISAQARGNQPVDLQISQKELAVMVGASRQATNRALTGLQSQGILETRYGSVRILDAYSLRQMARKRPSSTPR